MIAKSQDTHEACLRETSSETPDQQLGAAMQSQARPDATRVCDRLDSLKNLQDGWNSYAAPAPSRDAIENAKGLANEAERLGTTVDRTEPSALGGVGITFARAIAKSSLSSTTTGPPTRCSLMRRPATWIPNLFL